MANQKQLEILQSGVKAWNEWRENNPDVEVDLRGADLSGADLSGANLSGANLIEADLSWTNLSGANFFKAVLGEAYLEGADLPRADLSWANLLSADLLGANLRKANLFKADLSGTILEGANLSGADLSGADLSGAELSGADLSGADLSGADLSGADLNMANLRRASLRRADLSQADLDRADFKEAALDSTVLGDNDLSQVKGLDTIRHSGPSTIGIDTLVKSKGKIPEVFLRGCGVPDIFIEYMPALTQRPIQFYSCFISYSSQDTAFAKRLHADLQSKGVRCWFAPEDMKIGDKIRPTIDQSIRIHDKLLLVLSEHSMASQWVEHEVEHALDLEMERGEPVLFPVKLDQAVMESKTGWAAKIRRERHIGDFSQWKEHDPYQKGFERLLRDLKATEERDDSPAFLGEAGG